MMCVCGDPECPTCGPLQETFPGHPVNWHTVVTVGEGSEGETYGIEVEIRIVGNPEDRWRNTDLEERSGRRVRSHFRWHRVAADGAVTGGEWWTVFSRPETLRLVISEQDLQRLCEIWDCYQLNDSLVLTESQAEAVEMLIPLLPDSFGEALPLIEWNLERHGLLVDRGYRYLLAEEFLTREIPGEVIEEIVRLTSMP